MHVQITRAPIARALIAGAIATLLAACGNATGPTSPSRIRVSAHASHDDPPTDFCATGWVIIAGQWVCEDP